MTSIGQSARPRSSDLMAALADVESRFAVTSWSVDDLPVWPLVRLRWFFAEWARHYAGGSGRTRAAAAAQRIKALCSGPAAALAANHRDAAACLPGSAQREVVLLSDGISFTRLGERWVERFCDPLAALLQQRGLSTGLWTPLHDYRVPREAPSAFIQPMLDRATLAGALRARFGEMRLQLPDHEGVSATLEARGFDTVALCRAAIASDGARVHALADRYRAMLARTGARLGFVVSYYNIEGMAFVLACRRLGIPVFDLQHGVQGALHPAYAALPTPAVGALHTLVPDGFWVWSNWERDVIEAWSRGSGHRAVVGGNPWLQVWADSAERWPGVTEARARASALRGFAGDAPVVLVTLQYGLDAGQQLEPLMQLLRLAGERLMFWVRLHPMMLQRRDEVRARLAGTGRFELDEPTDLPLYALLPQAAVHLTHSSSTVIEAAQFGLRSVITSRFGEELYVPLVEAGWARPETGDAAALLARLTDLAAAAPARSAVSVDPQLALDALLAGVPAPAQQRRRSA
jgi:hypothetical protein